MRRRACAIVDEALPHIETQIELVASRRAALEELEDELTETRRRVREILLELRQRVRMSTTLAPPRAGRRRRPGRPPRPCYPSSRQSSLTEPGR